MQLAYGTKPACCGTKLTPCVICEWGPLSRYRIVGFVPGDYRAVSRGRGHVRDRLSTSGTRRVPCRDRRLKRTHMPFSDGDRWKFASFEIYCTATKSGQQQPKSRDRKRSSMPPWFSQLSDRCTILPTKKDLSNKITHAQFAEQKLIFVGRPT